MPDPSTHAALTLSPPQSWVHLWRVSHDNASTPLSVCGLTLPMTAAWLAEEATCPHCLGLLSNPRRPPTEFP